MVMSPLRSQTIGDDIEIVSVSRKLGSDWISASRNSSLSRGSQRSGSRLAQQAVSCARRSSISCAKPTLAASGLAVEASSGTDSADPMAAGEASVVSTAVTDSGEAGTDGASAIGLATGVPSSSAIDIGSVEQATKVLKENVVSRITRPGQAS